MTSVLKSAPSLKEDRNVKMATDEVLHPTRTQLPVVHERMLVFALRDGALQHVRDVPTGKACQCLCPACSEPLIAVNQGTKRAAHFRHEAHADCAYGYETSLHLAGKDALLRLKSVLLPEFRKRLEVQASDGKVFAETIFHPAQMVNADHAWEEVWIEGGSFRPDVVFQVKDVRLLIEIKVTHAVDDAKLEKVRARGISAIELDLSLAAPETLLNQESFDAFVVSNPLIRHWLFNRRRTEEEAQIMLRLQAAAAAYEPTAQRILASQRRRAQRDQQSKDRFLEPYRQTVKELREQLAPQLAQLAEHTAAQSREAIEPDQPFPGAERYLAPGLPRLFVPVERDGAFNATRDEWQAYVLDLLFPGADRRAALTLADLLRALRSQFGQPEFVTALSTAHREAEARCKSAPLLTIDEADRLPSAFRAIKDYLHHLVDLGIVTSKQHYFAGTAIRRYHARGLTVGEAWRAMAKQIAQSERREQQRKEQEASDAQQERFRRLEAKPVQEVEPAVAERVLAIRASEVWVHEVHGGHGCRCNACYMVMPQWAGSCPFCRARAGNQRVLIDQERLAMAPHLLPKSPAVTASLNTVQSLDLSGLVPFMERLGKKTETAC